MPAWYFEADVSSKWKLAVSSKIHFTKMRRSFDVKEKYLYLAINGLKENSVSGGRMYEGGCDGASAGASSSARPEGRADGEIALVEAGVMDISPGSGFDAPS